MSDPRYTVEIERLVLTGLDLTPGQAEELRVHVAGELQRLLAQGAWPADASRLSLLPPGLSVASAGDQLAGQLAQHIAQALPGGDRKGER